MPKAVETRGSPKSAKSDAAASESRTGPQIASWCLAAAALLLVLWLHLLSALLAGLLVYELVRLLAPLIQRHFSHERPRVTAVILLATVVVGALIAAGAGVAAFLHSDLAHLPKLLGRLAAFLERIRPDLPAWLADSIPTDPQALREVLTSSLRQHAPELELAGKEAGHVLARIVVGMVIGAIASLHGVSSPDRQKPLARALLARLQRLGDSFRNIVFAQVRISAINTVLTAIYLLVVLPILGFHLPLTKTLIVATFLFGLLPIVGNLLSNTLIVVASLAVSPGVALGSLAFLVAVHKLEYFLNAHIVGSHIAARSWELLVAMLVMEAAFGLAGLVAAPIYYAYLKRELVDEGLV